MNAACRRFKMKNKQLPLIGCVIIIPISTAIYWMFSWGRGEGFHKSVQLTLSVTKSICVRPLSISQKRLVSFSIHFLGEDSRVFISFFRGMKFSRFRGWNLNSSKLKCSQKCFFSSTAKLKCREISFSKQTAKLKCSQKNLLKLICEINKNTNGGKDK